MSEPTVMTIEPTDTSPTAPAGGIVVGIDGSEASAAALTWAAERTDEFGELRPVHAWDYPLSTWAPAPFGHAAVPPVSEMHAAAEEAAKSCVADLGDIASAEPVVDRGATARVLLRAAEDANLLVVGTRGRGPFRSNVLGSVGRDCADLTTVPLVIVPAPDPEAAATTHDRIVVGIDGSDHSAAALRWAVEHAPDGVEIDAITTWQTPVDGPILYGLNRFDIQAFRSGATHTVNETADAVCAELGVPAERVTRQIAEGDPRWVLMSASNTAGLLVLGQRGRTGLPHLVLGSTTTALIHRPHCPTVVVPS